MLRYKASEIAAASFILAAKILKKTTVWTQEIEKSTNILQVDLQNVIEDVRGFVLEINQKFLTTLKYKFSKTEYMEVATLPLKF